MFGWLLKVSQYSCGQIPSMCAMKRSIGTRLMRHGRASIDTSTFGEMIEFTTRQMKITRVYMPHLWLTAFMGSAIFNIVMIWATLPRPYLRWT